MALININIDNVQILGSGTIIQFNKKPIEFNFDLPNFPFQITFGFENNLEKPNENWVKFNLIDNNSLSIMFYNFNSSLGTSNNKPLKLGNYEGKHIYCNYRIYAFDSNSDKTIHYTFYLSEDEL